MNHEDRADKLNDTLVAERSYADRLLERLSAAEKETQEQARLVGMGAERELALMAKLEAAEKERDEANGYAEKMKAATGAVLRAHRLTIKRPAETMDKIENELEEIRRAAAMADEAVSTPAPAALSHLRQEIRREVLLELAELMDRGAGMSAAGLRNLAEQEKQG